jgi:hypothetical protein
MDARPRRHTWWLCSSPLTQTGHPGDTWTSALTDEPLLGALDVLIKRASWQDSIVALLLMPIILGMRHAWQLWLWATSSRSKR